MSGRVEERERPMSSVSSERTDATTTAIEEALGRIGERISEGEATAEVCKCKEGMFALAATRRQLFGSAGFIAAVGMTTMLPRSGEAKAPPGAVEYPVPADSTKEQGRMMGVDGGYGSRSQFRSEVRWANPTRTAAFTPLAERLRHHHAVGSALRTPSRRHSQYRSGTASPRSARLGRPTDQVLTGRPQALSDRVAHLFHGVLRYDR